MPRRLRLQYPAAIYPVMARGNGRQTIVRDEADRDRLLEHLGRKSISDSHRLATRHQRRLTVASSEYKEPGRHSRTLDSAGK
jgi:hypothetical protein